MVEKKVAVIEIMKLWPIFVALISGLIWLIRLEAKVLYLEKDQTKEVKRSSEKDRNLWKEVKGIREEVHEVKTTLARIEGSLSNKG